MYADTYCKYKRDQNGDYIFTGKCVITGEIVSVTIPAKELYAYRQGGLIQTTMPTLSKGEREFLMSGISDAGWAKVFSKEEE